MRCVAPTADRIPCMVLNVESNVAFTLVMFACHFVILDLECR